MRKGKLPSNNCIYRAEAYFYGHAARGYFLQLTNDRTLQILSLCNLTVNVALGSFLPFVASKFVDAFSPKLPLISGCDIAIQMAGVRTRRLSISIVSMSAARPKAEQLLFSPEPSIRSTFVYQTTIYFNFIRKGSFLTPLSPAPPQFCFHYRADVGFQWMFLQKRGQICIRNFPAEN